MKGFFSIRTKFLSVMSALLLVCLVMYLVVAVQVFKTDKTELVFDLNRSMVSNLSGEIETELNGISDKFRLFAILSTDKTNKIESQNIFGNKSSIVFTSLYKQNNLKPLKKYTDSKFLETYGLKEDFFEIDLQSKKNIPFNEISKNGEFIWNATIEGSVPLIGYGRSVVVENSKGSVAEQYAVVGYLKSDKIIKALNSVKLSEISILDKHGNTLLHNNLSYVVSTQNRSQDPLFNEAIKSKVNLSVLSLEDNNGKFLGAYAKSFSGQIIVLAKSTHDAAFSAVYQLMSRSVSLALIIITLSLLFTFILSRSLTEPISVLVDGMNKVSAGDLTTKIDVKSKDETQMLADSFNKMIKDLKQSRDELHEINRELDQKVKDRTKQLEIQNRTIKETQEALLKTTRMASAGEIAGRAAHEVLNPLTGILARLNGVEKRIHQQIEPQINLMKDIFSSWQNDEATGGFEKLVEVWKQKSDVKDEWNLWQEDIHNLNEAQKAFSGWLQTADNDAKFLIQESTRINKIVNGMRKLSSLNSDVKTYSIRSLLTDCHNIMADLFEQENIGLIENFSQQDDLVNIDRDEFIQAATNLMRNSLQAMQTATVKNPILKIHTQVSNNQIYIDFIDNGHGVSPENQKLLFEKQFTTKSKDDGTGLGLSISRRFIRGHGGDIELLSSTVDAETIFRITLPLAVNESSLNKAGAA